MTGIPLAAQAAAAAAADAAIEAAVHPLGRPRPGVVCGLDNGVGMIPAFSRWDVDGVADDADAVGVESNAVADEIEPKLVSDEEMGER